MIKKNDESKLYLFDSVVDKILEEEKRNYHNELISFDQHAAQIKEQVHLGEKLYIERMQKAINLLKNHFE